MPTPATQIPQIPQSDFVRRELDLYPAPWSGDTAKILGTGKFAALLNAMSGSFAFCQNNLYTLFLNTRLNTASGGALDLIAKSLLGVNLPRGQGETDTSYRARIKFRVFAPAITRQAFDTTLFNLTGVHPRIMEAWSMADTIAWGDWYYGRDVQGYQTNTVNTQNVVLGGTLNTGDTVSIIFNSAALPGNQVTISHTVNSGTDTIASIIAGFIASINANVSLSGQSITASAVPWNNELTITLPVGLSTYQTLPLVQGSSTVSGNGTEMVQVIPGLISSSRWANTAQAYTAFIETPLPTLSGQGQNPLYTWFNPGRWTGSAWSANTTPGSGGWSWGAPT